MWAFVFFYHKAMIYEVSTEHLVLCTMQKTFHSAKTGLEYGFVAVFTIFFSTVPFCVVPHAPEKIPVLIWKAHLSSLVTLNVTFTKAMQAILLSSVLI